MSSHDAIAPSPDALARRFDLLAADAAEYALFLVDPGGRVLCWNPGAERQYGYRPGEAVGRHFSLFFTPEDVISGRPEYELTAAREAGQTGGDIAQVRKDASRFWCRATVTTLFDEAHQVHAFARVTHDLTAEREREAEAKRAAGLAEANRWRDEFMAMLSHELRNPLSPILNALAILRRLTTTDPVVQQAAGIIERQVRLMVRLVDDLLDVGRMTKGKLRINPERVDLRVPAQRAAEAARPLLDARRHEFSLLLTTDPVWVTADAGRLEQVAVNLLTNAAKYTDPGGLVRMTVGREGEDAVLRVADNGVGIPAELLPRVFDLFTQVDASLGRSDGGLGIGLALIRSLVELHGGRVTAASPGPGQGSEFAVKLPALADAPAQPTPVASGSPVGAARRVLVVEDNVDAGDSLSLLLRLHGHDVRVVRTGPAALEVAAAFRPALVLLDIGLPGMDGYEVARRLRADPANAGATLCALSGYTPSEADRERPERAVFAHYFIKPVGLDALLAVLGEGKP